MGKRGKVPFSFQPTIHFLFQLGPANRHPVPPRRARPSAPNIRALRFELQLGPQTAPPNRHPDHPYFGAPVPPTSPIGAPRVAPMCRHIFVAGQTDTYLNLLTATRSLALPITGRADTRGKAHTFHHISSHSPIFRFPPNGVPPVPIHFLFLFFANIQSIRPFSTFLFLLFITTYHITVITMVPKISQKSPTKPKLAFQTTFSFSSFNINRITLHFVLVACLAASHHSSLLLPLSCCCLFQDSNLKPWFQYHPPHVIVIS